MRGLYDTKVRPGTFQELALVFREIRDQEAQYKSALASMGSDLKDPEDLIESLRDQLLPGRENQEERTQQQKANYIQSLQDVDWTEYLSLDSDVIEERKNQQKIKDELGPAASG